MAVAAPDIKSTFYRVGKGKGEGKHKIGNTYTKETETFSEVPNRLLPGSHWPQLCHAINPVCKGGWDSKFYFIFIYYLFFQPLY